MGIAAGVNLFQLAVYTCAAPLCNLGPEGELDGSTLACHMARGEQVSLTDSTPRLHTTGKESFPSLKLGSCAAGRENES